MATPTVVLFLRVPPGLAARVQHEAQVHGLSVNVYVTRLLQDYTGSINGKAV
jgi:predicted HicB family RNase H-like nuclease